MSAPPRPQRSAARFGSLAAVLLMASTLAPIAAATTAPRFLLEWDGLQQAYGVAVGPDGTVFVSESDASKISVFSPDGDFLYSWGKSGTNEGEFNGPRSLTVGPDGLVYVAESDNFRVQAFTPSGDHVRTFGTGTLGTDDGQFAHTYGVAVAPDGNVYVADSANDRIQYFSPTGVFIDKWGTLGNGPDELDEPNALAIAANGTVFVADSENHRIQVFSPTGDPVRRWGSFGTDDGKFDTPDGITIAPDGTVYVADTGNSRIQAFTQDGDHLVTWGSNGLGEGQFVSPRGVAVGPFGTVYVADADFFAARVQKFAFPSLTRAAGANRHATAAEISMLHHRIPAAVGTVFVATGANFPDALAGAVAAAAAGSPLLLAGSVPQATVDELDRLDPDDIVILGGEAVINSATATTLSGWGAVTRLFGANRYDTAVAISKHVYPIDGSADTVVIATGTGFADALAGASLAALGNGPVLLTQQGALPASVAAEISRLDPEEILVLGGEAAVSTAVFTQLQGLASTTRIFGPNRYATAVEVSKKAFPDGAGVVYIAVGTNFPDALAGAAQAAASGSPILLTPSNALPVEVVAEIVRLDPYGIAILGGTAVISQAVENHLKALLGL